MSIWILPAAADLFLDIAEWAAKPYPGHFFLKETKAGKVHDTVYYTLGFITAPITLSLWLLQILFMGPFWVLYKVVVTFYYIIARIFLRNAK